MKKKKFLERGERSGGVRKKLTNEMRDLVRPKRYLSFRRGNEMGCYSAYEMSGYGTRTKGPLSPRVTGEGRMGEMQDSGALKILSGVILGTSHFSSLSHVGWTESTSCHEEELMPMGLPDVPRIDSSARRKGVKGEPPDRQTKAYLRPRGESK